MREEEKDIKDVFCQVYNPWDYNVFTPGDDIEDEGEFEMIFAHVDFAGSHFMDSWDFNDDAILLDSGSTTNIFGKGCYTFLTDFETVKM